jgi:hypothetical protein
VALGFPRPKVCALGRVAYLLKRGHDYCRVVVGEAKVGESVDGYR